jgi:hypothetical protein
MPTCACGLRTRPMQYEDDRRPRLSPVQDEGEDDRWGERAQRNQRRPRCHKESAAGLPRYTAAPWTRHLEPIASSFVVALCGRLEMSAT